MPCVRPVYIQPFLQITTACSHLLSQTDISLYLMVISNMKRKRKQVNDNYRWQETIESLKSHSSFLIESPKAHNGLLIVDLLRKIPPEL